MTSLKIDGASLKRQPDKSVQQEVPTLRGNVTNLKIDGANYKRRLRDEGFQKLDPPPNTGANMPTLGFGTYLSNGEELLDALLCAVPSSNFLALYDARCDAITFCHLCVCVCVVSFETPATVSVSCVTLCHSMSVSNYVALFKLSYYMITI